MTNEELQEIIIAFLAKDNEIDNLGDGESICFQDELPTVNIVQLAAAILERMEQK
jgi:hypothetical protein